MKGLFKSNFLLYGQMQKFFYFMFAMGIAIIIIPDQTWQMYFIIIELCRISSNATTVIEMNFSSKWGKYKLTFASKGLILKSFI